MHRFIWVLLAFSSVLTAHAQVAQIVTPPLAVSYKHPEFGDLERKTFEQQIIELALEKTQGKMDAFDMVPINIISRTHAIAALNKNLYKNFVMALSYEDKLVATDNLIYIPFPIDLGALSYRICYVNERLREQVRTIAELTQLQQYKIGVGTGWLEVKIFQQAGLPMVEGSNITSLFRMTQAGRVDIFCPSPSEYFHALQAEKATDLQLDNKLALHYPPAKIFIQPQK